MAGFGFGNVGFVGSLGGPATPPAPANLFKNYSFDSPATGNIDTGWNTTGGAVIGGGVLTLNGNTDTTQRVATLILGARYRLSAILHTCTVGYVQVLTDTGGNGQISGDGGPTPLDATHKSASIDFTATSNSDIFYIRGQGATNATMEFLSIVAL